MSEIEDWLGRTSPKSFEHGITALDLLDLPLTLNKIMHRILTRVHMTETELRTEVAAQPLETRLSSAELLEILDALCARHWLSRSGSGEDTTYQVNLRTRATQPKTRSKVWEALDFDT